MFYDDFAWFLAFQEGPCPPRRQFFSRSFPASVFDRFFDGFVDHFASLGGSIWGPFGTPGALLGPLWAPKERSWGVLGALWGDVGPLGVAFGDLG